MKSEIFRYNINAIYDTSRRSLSGEISTHYPYDQFMGQVNASFMDPKERILRGIVEERRGNIILYVLEQPADNSLAIPSLWVCQRSFDNGGLKGHYNARRCVVHTNPRKWDMQRFIIELESLKLRLEEFNWQDFSEFNMRRA